MRLFKLFYLLLLSFTVLGSAPLRIPHQWVSHLGSAVSDKYFSTEYELSFIGKKEKIDSYLSFFIQNVDFKNNSAAKVDYISEVDAAVLGAKGGVMLPLLSEFGLAPHIGVGWGRSNLAVDPWLGDRENSLGRKQLFLIETGAYIFYDRVVFKLNYKLTSLNYLSNSFSLALGLSY